MSKDSVVSDEAKLAGSSNFHLWKYMITHIAKKEKLWSILSQELASTSSTSKSSSETKQPNESDEEKVERLMYIMSMSIKPSLLSQLTEY